MVKEKKRKKKKREKKNNKTGDFEAEAYNMRRENVELTSIEKGQRVKCIIEINQIWFIDNKFGVSVRLKQVLLEPSKKLPRFAFKNVEEPPVEDEEDEEREVDEE